MRAFTPWLIVVTLTAAGAAAAAGYALTAPKQYRATAQLLVSPVSAADPTFAGLDVFRDVPGKASAAQSAAVLVRSPQVADAVRAQLGVRRSRDSLLHEVHAHVVGGSSVVDVSVEDGSATTAAQLANAFVDALIAQRTAGFQSQLTSAIRRDGDLLGGNPGDQKAELARRLAVLRSFQGQPDPTLRRAATATAPSSASWPELGELVLVGAGVGLAVGAVCWLVLAIMRGGVPARPREYSPGVSDRALQALVDRLEQRIAARESALAARERDLQARIEELRALDARPAAGEEELRRREAELHERVAAVTQRELAVARAAVSAATDEDVRRREEELAARERELQARVEELPPADDSELRRREAELEKRVAAVTRRELAVARAAASAAADEDGRRREDTLARREQELAERVAAVTQREIAVARLAAGATEGAVQPAAAARDVPGFDLVRLEQLVAERGGAHPERLDEWESTLFFLREYAEADGTLPGSFDWLVQDTFAPLLDSPH